MWKTNKMKIKKTSTTLKTPKRRKMITAWESKEVTSLKKLCLEPIRKNGGLMNNLQKKSW